MDLISRIMDNLSNTNRNTNKRHSSVGYHYWVVLHTMAQAYPTMPTSTMKKDFYQVIQVMPQLLPPSLHRELLVRGLTEIPMAGYLDNRDTLMHWTFLLHNWFNRQLQKSVLTKAQFMAKYAANPSHQPPHNNGITSTRGFLFLMVSIAVIVVGLWWYNI
jgi:hypothetical protein